MDGISIIINSSAVLALISIIYILFTSVRENKKDEKERTELYDSIVEEVIKSLDNGNIESIDDILTITRNVKNKLYLSQNDDIIVLEKTKFKLMLDETKKDQLKLIKQLIEIRNNQEPFFELEDDEKILLTDILNFKEEVKQKEIFESKMKHLSTLIKNKYNDNKTREEQERKKYFLTVAIGIIGIALSYYYGNKQNPDLININEQLIEINKNIIRDINKTIIHN